MSGLTYLITGANRGIGKALLEVYLSRPNHAVIAAVRDVASSTKTLSALPVGVGSKLIVVKVDSKVDTDPSAAVAELKSKGITKVDVLISNAGYMGPVTPLLETSTDVIRESFEVNTIGPFNLIKAFKPLLEASSAPKFLVLTSTIGSFGELPNYQVPFFSYGVSKAAANYLVAKLKYEVPSITAQAFNPGWLQTDMGTGAAKGVGMADAPMSIEDGVKGLVTVFDAASIEKTGTFTAFDGTNIPW